MSRYELWHVRRKKNVLKDKDFTVSILKEIGSRSCINIDTDHASLFLIDEGSGRSLPLFAFLDVDGSVDGKPPSLESDLPYLKGTQVLCTSLQVVSIWKRWMVFSIGKIFFVPRL